MPAPFQPVGSPAPSVNALSLASANVPPIDALTPVSGINFSNAVQLGPALILADLAGMGLLWFIVRRRWTAHAS
jgi:hypothetical protein